MPAKEYYTSFLGKLERLRKREISLFTLSRFLKLSVVFGVVLYSAVLIESYLWLPVSSRLYITAILAAAGIGLSFFYLAGPVRAWFGRDARFTVDSLSGKVGRTFPDIRDRLKNALQVFHDLTKNSGYYSKELIIETMERTGAAFQSYDFNKSINYAPVKKRALLFSLFILVVSGGLAVYSGAMAGAMHRLLNPGTEYPVPTAFTIAVTPGNTEVVRYDPVDLSADITGDLPAAVSLYMRPKAGTGFERHDMAAGGNGAWTFRLEKVRDSFEYYISGAEPNGILPGRRIKSSVYTVDVIYRPAVRNLKLFLDYPAYSGIEDVYLEDNIGDAAALAGTRIRAEVTVNKTVRAAEIAFDDGSVLPLTVSGRRATGEFTVDRNVRYTVKLTDPDGIENTERIEYRISNIPDTYPFAQIVVPGEDTDLNEDRMLPAGIRISDDFGITKLRIGFRLIDRDDVETDTGPERIEELLATDGAFRYIDLPLENRSGVLQDVLTIWSLANLAMFPEDIVLYFAEVYDNDAVSGPKRTRTRTYIVRLPSLEELFSQAAETQQEQQGDLEDILDESRDIKKELDETAYEMMRSEELEWEQKQKAEDAMRRQQEVQKRMDEIKKEMDELVEKFEQNDMLSADVLDKYKELQELLGELATPEMQEMMNKLQETLENSKNQKQNRQNLDNLRSAQEDYLKRVERTLNILKRLQVEQMMDEVVVKSEKIAETQELINTKTDSLQRQSDTAGERKTAQEEQQNQASRKEESDKLSRQEEELAQTMENMQETVDRLLEKMIEQPDMSTEKIAEVSRKMQEQRMQDTMREMSRELFRQSIEQAMESGEEIMEQLEQMNEEIKEAHEQLTQDMKQQIMTEMMKASGDLLQMSEKQEATRRESMDLTVNSDQYRDIADKQYNLMSGLQRTIMNLVKLSEKTFFLTPELGAALGSSQNAMQQAITALEERNARGTQQQQQKSMESLNTGLQSLRQSMQNAQSSGSGVGFEQFMQQMEKLTGQQQGINGQTGRMPMSGQGMSMEQQAAMERLAQQQETVRKSLEQLMNEMKGAGSGSMKDRLGQMSGDMEEVGQQLQDKNVTDRTLQLQERIVSRMLDAQRSINRRDFSKKRYAEQANRYEGIDPGRLPAGLGESRLILQESLEKALKEGYSRDFEDLIRKYFEQLKTQRDIKKDGGK